MPQPRTLSRARLLWEQSVMDLKTAKQKNRQRAFLDCAHLSLQAAVNGLSAVCVLNGHFQLPASSAMGLLQLCLPVEERFEALAPACDGLDQGAEASPFPGEKAPAADREMARAALGHADEVLGTVKGYLRENRERFFAP